MSFTDGALSGPISLPLRVLSAMASRTPGQGSPKTRIWFRLTSIRPLNRPLPNSYADASFPTAEWCPGPARRRIGRRARPGGQSEIGFCGASKAIAARQRSQSTKQVSPQDFADPSAYFATLPAEPPEGNEEPPGGGYW